MKLAILQNGDSPQIESSAAQLRAAGYETRWCGPELRDELRREGCDTVLAPEQMYALGYDRIDSEILPATLADMDRCDLFCEIKIRNVPRIWRRWPRLKGRVAWWRVNGAQPEICPVGGDEVNLICPIITACMWYGTDTYRQMSLSEPSNASKAQASAAHEHPQNSPALGHGKVTLGDNGMAYVMWPPYPKSGEYTSQERPAYLFERPYSLCHSGRAWGYGQIVDECVRMGVRFFGNNSPHGQISHRKVAQVAREALCLVHLKSVDCPGWALYEAMLSGCPVVTGRLLSSRMLASDLLQHGETCLEFGVPASLEYGRGDMNFEKCLTDIEAALERLSNPNENRRIGQNGKKRLLDLMWNEERDGQGFKAFMERHFP